jgi:hypothetical protein
MYPTARVLLAAGTLSLAQASGAQRPDFSGEWVRVVDSAGIRPSVAATGDAAFRRGDMGSGWGSPFIIRQSADSMVVEFTHFATYDLQPRLRFAFALDGSESRNTIMIGHADSPQRSRVTWRGDTLVIATTFPAPAGADGRPGTTAVRQALALDTDGSLVMETTRESSPVLKTRYGRRN